MKSFPKEKSCKIDFKIFRFYYVQTQFDLRGLLEIVGTALLRSLILRSWNPHHHLYFLTDNRLANYSKTKRQLMAVTRVSDNVCLEKRQSRKHRFLANNRRPNDCSDYRVKLSMSMEFHPVHHIKAEHPVYIRELSHHSRLFLLPFRPTFFHRTRYWDADRIRDIVFHLCNSGCIVEEQYFRT